MKRLTIKCILLCELFGIANKNYMKRPASTSYLGQQSKLENIKVYYWAMCKMCKVRGGGGGGGGWKERVPMFYVNFVVGIMTRHIY